MPSSPPPMPRAASCATARALRPAPIATRSAPTFDVRWPPVASRSATWSRALRQGDAVFTSPCRFGEPTTLWVASCWPASTRQQLARQLAAKALPPGAEALVLDPEGTVVAGAEDGHPVVDRWVGGPAPEVLRTALHVSAPAAVTASGPDGNPRLFGAVPLDPALGGIVAAVGLDQRRALADLRAASRDNLAGLLLGAVFALSAGVLGARRLVLAPLARLALTADQAGEGDLQARADLGRRSDKVREVGAAFSRMSAALAAREGERDRSEAALRESEARFRHMADSAPALIWMSDVQGQLVFANMHYEHVFGRPAAAMLGQGWEQDVLAGGPVRLPRSLPQRLPRPPDVPG